MSVCEYERFARLSSDPVVIVQDDGRIVASNSAAADLLSSSGRTSDKDALVGRTLVDLFSDSREAVDRLVRDCLAKADPVAEKIVLGTSGDTPLECSCRGLLLQRLDDDRRGLIGIQFAFGGQVATAQGDMPRLDDETRARRDLENRLLAISQNQEALNQLLGLSLKETPLDDLLGEFLDTLLGLPWLRIKARGAIFLVGDRPGVLTMRADRGNLEETRTMCREIRFGQCLCGQAASSGETIFVDGIDERHEGTYPGMDDHGHYCIPLIASGKAVLGVLTLYVGPGHVQDELEMAFLQAAANILVGIVQSRLAKDKLEKYASDLEVVNRHLEESSFAAQAATHAKSDFLANMSHEIRTPMTAIIGYIELIAEGCQNRCAFSHTTGSHLEAVRRNADYLLGLINNILDLSKIEAGQCHVERIECSLPQLVSEIVSLMMLRAREKGLALVVQYDGPIPETIVTDPIRLRQILVNLIGNAIKFTECGEVRVAIRILDRDGDEPKLQVGVIDTGIGMKPSQIPKLFQPFTQADSSTTRKFGGTGLGLTISKRLAEMLGGQLRAESVLHKGSTFTATVAAGSLQGVRWLQNPAEDQPPVDNSATPLPRKKQKPTVDGRILLVEDGPDNQRLISFVLKKGGGDVEIAENGLIAIERIDKAQAEARPFDVVLMDMQMPVMDGYAATKQLRAEGFTRPIIALTAHAMSGDRQKCLDAGCDDYLTKPIDRSVLLTTVAQSIAASSGGETPKRQPTENEH